MRLNELAKLMRIAGDESRLKILCVIFSKKKICVSDIAKELDMRIASLAELRQNYAGKKIQDITADAADQIPTVVSVYRFAANILYGASGQAVTELQKRLKSLNLYGGAIDGHYTVSVVATVRKYQKNNGIKQTGNVGPATAASLNK